VIGAKLEKARALRQAGLSLRAIGRKVGVSAMTVRRMVG
jgi:lambda repressor-like predicted transcriptional regulator